MPHALAGKPAPAELLVDPTRLIDAYYDTIPNPSDPATLVSFGTSGHRGSSLAASFNEAHILATTQAICEYRKKEGITGPLFLGKDTHALSGPAQETALEVLAGNGVDTIIAERGGFTPTPSISRLIIAHNRDRSAGIRQADGIVVTPSHNPPEDGGFKYNPPHGGPADTDATGWIEERANALLRARNAEVRRLPIAKALAAPTTRQQDFVTPYLDDLPSVIDLEAIAKARVRCAVDPLGGASVHYWEAIGVRFGLELALVNPAVDARFSFMTVDHDGKIRMDCSSPYAMAALVGALAGGAGNVQVAFGNDPDADRHGIVVPGAGLLNPNHYLAVAIDYLFAHRPGWPARAGVGKTLVSSAIIDRVAAALGRPLNEVPVGFKWFVPGLSEGTLGFGGEESAGASFLRRDGSTWTTDKDGIILNLLAAEMIAVTGRDPAAHHRALVATHGQSLYTRVDRPATPAQKARLKRLAPSDVRGNSLAGEPIDNVFVRAPGNDAPIGGLKVVAKSGWFAARPSGTENIYKIYAESFSGSDHLARLVDEAGALVLSATAAA